MAVPTNLSDLQRMELQINTLFCCDPDGKLRCVNEIGEPQAPRFFMGRTSQGNLWRFRYDLAAATVEKLDRLCRSEPVAVDLSTPPRNYAALKAVLHEDATSTDEFRGPAYWIRQDSRPATDAVIISEENAACLRNTFDWMLPLVEHADVGPIAALIREGNAVSLCFCARRPALATEAGVETVPAFRGKGYATAVVARWAAEVRRQGCLPLYSTAWDNLASQAVARKLQMVQYGEDWSIR